QAAQPASMPCTASGSHATNRPDAAGCSRGQPASDHLSLDAASDTSEQLLPPRGQRHQWVAAPSTQPATKAGSGSLHAPSDTSGQRLPPCAQHGQTKEALLYATTKEVWPAGLHGQQPHATTSSMRPATLRTAKLPCSHHHQRKRHHARDGEPPRPQAEIKGISTARANHHRWVQTRPTSSYVRSMSAFSSRRLTCGLDPTNDWRKPKYESQSTPLVLEYS
ncbi:hypothetical protein Dimus_029628, partial [Dionaea muscipula]